MAAIALIHTSPAVLPTFKALSDELLGGHRTFNVVDESLLCDIQRDGKLAAATAKRLIHHVTNAGEAGAEFVLVTCSSMGRAVEASRVATTATVLRVDEPMAAKAVALGRRVGVIATLPSTLEPTADLIQRTANLVGNEVSVHSVLVEGAFAAVISGDGRTHDELVSKALRELAGRVDVIVLAQASMARVVDALSPAEKPVPILASPRLAIEHLAQRLRDRKEQ